MAVHSTSVECRCSPTAAAAASVWLLCKRVLLCIQYVVMLRVDTVKQDLLWCVHGAGEKEHEGEQEEKMEWDDGILQAERNWSRKSFTCRCCRISNCMYNYQFAFKRQLQTQSTSCSFFLNGSNVCVKLWYLFSWYIKIFKSKETHSTLGLDSFGS